MNRPSLFFDAVAESESVIGDLDDTVQMHEGGGHDKHVEDLVALELWTQTQGDGN